MNLVLQVGKKITFPTRIIYFDKIIAEINVRKINIFNIIN